MKLPTLLLLLLSAAACGSTSAVDPIVQGPDAPGGPAGSAPAPTTPVTPAPTQPIGPYTGAVATTDVSILYPLSSSARSSDYVSPAAAGAHGALLPESFATVVLGLNGSLDPVDGTPSTYAALRVVSLRLDPCSARGASGCRSEARIVLQALNDVDGLVTATDGGIHVVYDVAESELVTMLKQILTLKKANGDLASQELAPHPILAAQGLAGAFAKGLPAIVLEHLGESRIARVTVFDHGFPDEDSWTFALFERSGGSLARVMLPFVDMPSLTVVGRGAADPLASSGVSPELGSTPDPVGSLVSTSRPAPGASASVLQPAYESALRVQNPKLHTSESTSCVNCHLAEGARNLGESVYGFTSAIPANTFTSARSLARKDERTSVTNLHAFGYLHRQVSIMARTANESAVVADAMAAKVK